MHGRPLISIITVNLNNLSGLERTMQSVFEQSWQKFEYLVIDGGSTDGSREFIDKHHEKIDYWVSEQDRGIYHAMNKGIKTSKGEYLLFLNSGDDFIEAETMEKYHHFIKEQDLVYFDIKVIGKKTSFIKKCPPILTFSYLLKDTLPHQSIFIKKSLFDKIGFYDESLKIVADWKFLILALGKYNASYIHVNEVLANYFLDGISSHSSNWTKIVEERQSVLDNEFKFFLEDYDSISQLENKLSTLKNSRKIKWMVRLGLLNKF